MQAFYIPSGSMQQTLDLQDRVLVNKLVYELRYETRNRPEWATIPIVGMLRLLEPVT